ncbi:hypothetical protein [Nonomuraea gerenzanensis]|uniref:Uncharacterized protein n=1 Tax=Nonomuraea gerenzanensis TaxID=93944 RepID=A0A1M4EII6_9ACTN|nr:hypothetical protein [Nonomuraea gerenzanensis]UBU10351.1 hypothetical protein LCN96_39275 [Nonomuraea gerenzanensis]SBO98741.1 hypothetical protein BN4615_P8257 [Nonomuraea gerenzanensis]
MHSARKNPRKLWARILAVLTALLTAALAGVVLAYPSLAATTCPGCYGLTELEASVHTEADLSQAQKAQIQRTVTEARRRITTFYGSRTSSPTLLACATESCYQRIGGGRERGIAVLNRAVMLSPKGLDAVIASHEMSHVELHTRLTSGEEVPQWFDEGLAVVVSDDRRYLAPATSADRCLTSPTGPLPVTLDEWLSAASKDAGTYAKSACQVSRWLRDNGGRTGLLSLIDHLNAGTPFTTLVPSP